MLSQEELDLIAERLLHFAVFRQGAIDELAALPEEAPAGVRVVYVSPLKALVADIERNLRSPLAGITRTAERLRAAKDRPWPARQRVFDQELRALAGMPNEAAQVIAPNLDACERQLRWNVAHLRLLRQAVALHLGAGDPLTDPLADGPLHVEHRDDVATVASAGDDGRGKLRREVRPRAQSTGARTSFTKR